VLQFPVFVKSKDSGDVNSYQSVGDMQRKMERIDIENEEYEAWDVTGLPLKLSVHESKQWLGLQPAKDAQPRELASAIIEFALRQNVPIDASRLFAGGFPAALAQIISGIQVQRQTQSWWQRFKGHF